MNSHPLHLTRTRIEACTGALKRSTAIGALRISLDCSSWVHWTSEGSGCFVFDMGERKREREAATIRSMGTGRAGVIHGRRKLSTVWEELVLHR